ncbi:hypothetical protein V1525DRAFT_437604 [Lipomyces kononenkoae]|uniref:Uncharacterized protein n=1 Tax=Lipomyces kononenkoae TaxID=34357 RepID=A0ACC3ST37_LIPKO
MYESGKLKGLTGGIRTWLRDGEVLDHEPGIDEVTPGTAIWLEILSHECQVPSDLHLMDSLLGLQCTRYLQISDLFLNGVVNLSTPVVIANYTGSDIQTIFDADLILLNYDQNTYAGRLRAIALQTANVLVMRQRIPIQIQIIDSTGRREMTSWFLESAVIVPPASSLWSGNAYLPLFCNSAWNCKMAVKKHGLMTQLPIV